MVGSPKRRRQPISQFKKEEKALRGRKVTTKKEFMKKKAGKK